MFDIFYSKVDSYYVFPIFAFEFCWNVYLLVELAMEVTVQLGHCFEMPWKSLCWRGATLIKTNRIAVLFLQDVFCWLVSIISDYGISVAIFIIIMHLSSILYDGSGLGFRGIYLLFYQEHMQFGILFNCFISLSARVYHHGDNALIHVICHFLIDITKGFLWWRQNANYWEILFDESKIYCIDQTVLLSRFGTLEKFLLILIVFYSYCSTTRWKC